METMPSKQKTSVVLTEKAHKVRIDNLAFGLKELLSAGLELFGQLSDSEQKRMINRIKAEEDAEAAVRAAAAGRPRGRPKKHNRNDSES